MQLYNTKTRQKEKFVPQDSSRVTMYVCGPTVYSYAHIGNARPAVVFDLLARVLRREFDCLIYTRNITDIDDKINKAAQDQEVPISEITERYITAYHHDLSALGVLSPDIEPRVTTHMPQIIAMIETLIKRGHAYEADGNVLFNVGSFEQYGELSGRDQDQMLAGARVKVASYKKDPSDFILWKPSDDQQPGWDSPWGRGRPGWHIECSVMAETHLGDTIDIHGGGHDLIFPHHENENAQSVCAHGVAFCNYWVHNGFVNVEHEKMSKSIGNILLVKDLLKRAPGEAIRYALLSAHYRAPLDWTEPGLHQAKRSLDRLYLALRKLKDVTTSKEPTAAVTEKFLAALEDDLNTPEALAELFALVRTANSSQNEEERSQLKAAILGCGELLGLLQQDPEQWFAGDNDELDRNQIDALVAARDQARADRNFTRADEIRDQLDAMNIIVEDGADGSRWRKS